jgi:voltage-gated potassium channel
VSFFDPESEPREGWRARAYDIIFHTDTVPGRLFDFVLLALIMLSVVAVSLETVPGLVAYKGMFRTIEWIVTGLFTIEYVLRLVIVREPKRYALSFMGLVDLVSLLPTYLSLVLVDAQALQVVRALRLLRVFRLFQLGKMTSEGNSLMRALSASRYKIGVFMVTMMIIVTIQGALVYFIEHRINPGFSSIPRAVYWAVVTLTTVGYGDIAPQTVPGQFIAALLMLLGYGIIAVPTGIVTAEVALTEMAHRQHEHELELEREAHVLLPANDPSTCAGVVPAAAVVHGGTDEQATIDP